MAKIANTHVCSFRNGIQYCIKYKRHFKKLKVSDAESASSKICSEEIMSLSPNAYAYIVVRSLLRAEAQPSLDLSAETI